MSTQTASSQGLSTGPVSDTGSNLNTTTQQATLQVGTTSPFPITSSPHSTNSSTSLDSTQKTTTIVTTTASGSSTSVFHGSNTTIAIVSGSNITTHGSTTATASGSNTAISPPLTATTAPGSETVTSHRSTTTTTSASSSAATLDGFADHGSSRKLSKGVAVVVALGAVIVISLILMFAWQRRTKRRHFQKQPRGSVLFGSGPSQGTWGLASEPEKARSKAEASPGTIPTALMPACRPSISRHSDVAGSEFTKGHRSVCVDNNISWRLAVETRKHYKSASHPGSLPPPYGAPRVAPPGKGHHYHRLNSRQPATPLGDGIDQVN